MTSYKTFQAELERLHQESERTRRAEKRDALNRILALVAEYRIELEDLGFGPDVREKVAPKYRDPETGATWSGRGREPLWLRGKDRAKFGIL